MLNDLLSLEWQAVKQNPASFLVALAVGVGMASAFWFWFYSDRISDLRENIARYRIASGLDKPSNKTSMTELTNSELKRKAKNLAERTREIRSIHESHLNKILFDTTLTSESKAKQEKGEMERAWKQFEAVRVDALMVTDELRARLPSKIKERVMTPGPQFSSADDPEAKVTLGRLMLQGGFAIGYITTLSSELEELGKLQLEQLQVCTC